MDGIRSGSGLFISGEYIGVSMSAEFLGVLEHEIGSFELLFVLL